MTELAADSFDRGNSANLGANWTIGYQSGATRWQISSNEASYGNSEADHEYYNGVTWPADQYSEVTLGTIHTTSDEGCGPTVRASTSTGAYFAQTNTTETRLYLRTNAGSYTQLPQPTPTNASPCVSGDVLKLKISGSNLTLERNGTPIITATDSTLSTGNAGMWASTVGHVQSWAGGNLDAPAGSTTLMGQAVM